MGLANFWHWFPPSVSFDSTIEGRREIAVDEVEAIQADSKPPNVTEHHNAVEDLARVVWHGGRRPVWLEINGPHVWNRTPQGPDAI